MFVFQIGDPDTDGYFKPEKNASTSTFSNAQGKDLHCSGEPKRGNNVENEEAGQKSKCRRRKTIHVSLYLCLVNLI